MTGTLSAYNEMLAEQKSTIVYKNFLIAVAKLRLSEQNTKRK